MSDISKTQPSSPDAIAMRRHAESETAATECLQDLAPHLGAYVLSPAVWATLIKHLVRHWDRGRESARVPNGSA